MPTLTIRQFHTRLVPVACRDHPSSTLFACQTHKRGFGRNKNKELARGQETFVVTRFAHNSIVIMAV